METISTDVAEKVRIQEILSLMIYVQSVFDEAIEKLQEIDTPVY